MFGILLEIHRKQLGIAKIERTVEFTRLTVSLKDGPMITATQEWQDWTSAVYLTHDDVTYDLG